ncbi:MAG: hypothetical protein SOY42_03405 [Clostridium sp.]|nr:hypothetical protein [Clostridium sp.]
MDKMNILKDAPDYEDYTQNIVKESKVGCPRCCGKCGRCNNTKCNKEIYK